MTGFVEVRLPVETARAFVAEHNPWAGTSCKPVFDAIKASLPPELPDEPPVGMILGWFGIGGTCGGVCQREEPGWCSRSWSGFRDWEWVLFHWDAPGGLRVLSPGPVLNGNKT